MIRWNRVPIVIAVYTGLWLLVLSPWREHWPGLLLNWYILSLYFGLMALVAVRLSDDFRTMLENKKLRWLFLAKRVEGPLSTRVTDKPVDTNIREGRSDGIKDGNPPGN